MEVILPPNLDKSLLIKDDKLCGEIYMGCDSSGRTEISQDGKPHRFIFSSSTMSMPRNYKETPPKAIWATIYTNEDCYKYSYSDFDVIKPNPYNQNIPAKILPNLVRPLVNIPLRKEVFNIFPESEYCIIQNDQDYATYLLDNIITYPNSPTLTAEVIKPLLEQRLQQYGGEQAYKIIRRQVILVKLVGKSLIKNSKFQELLLVDCNILNSEILTIAQELGLGLYRCSLIDRKPLLGLLHHKLIGNVTLPVITNPIIDAIKVNADKLADLANLLNSIYTITDEINKLRMALCTNTADKDLINTQLVQSSEIISKLRCDNRTANSKIDQLEIELSARITRIKSLEEQLALSHKSEKSLNETIVQLKDKIYKANKRINILEINAAKDEALIHNLRAEKAHWNSNPTRSFEDEQKRIKEIQELKDRLNSLL